MELIDRDEMLKRLESWNTDDEMDKALYNFTLNRIIEQPTVDAEPVIRCMDCIYSVDEYDDGECYCEYEVLTYIKDWNHFCGHQRGRQEKQNDS